MKLANEFQTLESEWDELLCRIDKDFIQTNPKTKLDSIPLGRGIFLIFFILFRKFLFFSDLFDLFIFSDQFNLIDCESQTSVTLKDAINQKKNSNSIFTLFVIIRFYG